MILACFGNLHTSHLYLGGGIGTSKAYKAMIGSITATQTSTYNTGIAAPILLNTRTQLNAKIHGAGAGIT